jgi:hypothetical protein
MSTNTSTSTYALIQNGKVHELFKPPAGFTLAQSFHKDTAAKFTDVTNVSPQPQVGWTATKSGSSYTFSAPPPAPAPTLAQQAAAALAKGLAITSRGDPKLNGVYDISAASQQKINATALYIAVNQKFPGGQTTYPWLDKAGSVHTFPSTAEFFAFATAVADYVAQLDMIIATGAGTLPASTATIA